MILRILKIVLMIFLLIIGIIYVYLAFFTHQHGMPQCSVVQEQTSGNFQSDSVTVIPATCYEGGFFKQFLQGKNYRKAWSTPISVPVIHFDSLYGGLTAVKEGGGNQTQSLKWRDTLGNYYSLRSVNKDPTGLVPPIGHKLRLSNIVTDGISAQHPYGAILVSPLAEALQLFHTNPQLVFVPEQSTLDTFNNKFKDRLYLLEYENKGAAAWTNNPAVIEITDTEEIQELLMDNDTFEIDIETLVRARLFDIVIGDWDRHAKNWGWLIVKDAPKLKGIPIAFDRDNVFYNVGGFIPTIVNRPAFVPILRPFREEVDYMPGLVKKFDQYFLHDVSLEIFLQEAEFIQKNLTNAVIKNAFKSWSPEIRQLDEADISKKLKARRDNLPAIATDFYDAIQKAGPFKGKLKGSTKLWEERGLRTEDRKGV